MSELRRTIIQSSPILCNVSENSGVNIDITVTCSVLYDYLISSRADYYRNFGMDSGYFNETFDKKLKDDTDLALQIAFAEITQSQPDVQQLQQSAEIIREEMTHQLTDKWKTAYGVDFSSIEVSEIKMQKEEVDMISSFADDFENMNPDILARNLSPWICSCGEMSNGKFCPECGKRRPEKPEDGWKCINCGTINHGKFCTGCGNAFEMIVH